MSEHLHYVTVTNPGGDNPRLTFECKGTPEAKCHQYPDCECESWDDDHRGEHPFTPHEECWVQGWADAFQGSFVYAGEDAYDNLDDHGMPNDFPPRTGPVETWFEEEWVEWKWAS